MLTSRRGGADAVLARARGGTGPAPASVPGAGGPTRTAAGRTAGAAPGTPGGRTVSSAWLVPGLAALVASLAVLAVTLRRYPQLLWNGLDMTVYRGGGDALRHGQPVYDLVWTGLKLHYTYPPITLAGDVVLGAVSFHGAMVAITVLSIASLGVTAWLCLGMAGIARCPGRIGLTALALAGALWLEPVSVTLNDGQVNTVLMLLVVADLAVHDRRRWKGAGIGLATGIKLVPGIFIVYLLLTRRLRAAAVSAGVFVATVAVGFAVSPSGASAYWGGAVFDSHRVSDPNPIDFFTNQSLHGLAARLVGGDGTALWLPLNLVVGVGGLVLAVALQRRGMELLGMLVVALTGLLASPVSWDHHWVWIVPVLIYAWVGTDRLTGRWRLAAQLGTVLLTALFAEWPFRQTNGGILLPTGILRRTMTGRLSQGLLGFAFHDMYVAPALAFLVGVAVWLWLHRDTVPAAGRLALAALNGPTQPIPTLPVSTPPIPTPPIPGQRSPAEEPAVEPAGPDAGDGRANAETTTAGETAAAETAAAETAAGKTGARAGLTVISDAWLVPGVALLLASLFAYLQLIRWRPDLLWNGLDLSVYQGAGLAVRHGQAVYDLVWTGFKLPYTYPPITFLPDVGLSYLSPRHALALMTVVSLGALAATAWYTLGMAGLAGVRGRLGVVALTIAVAMWLEPVFLNARLGQVNAVLMVLVVADLACADRRWWKGAGIGLAAGAKLVPGIFIGYLLLTRRFRAAAVSAGVFLATVAVGFVVAPNDSADYWGGAFLDSHRVASAVGVEYLSDQSLHGLAARYLPGDGTAVWMAAAALVGVAGLALAALVQRRGQELLGMLVAAVTGLLISPIAWGHHWVWAVPLLLFAWVTAVRWTGRRRLLGQAAAAVLTAAFVMWPYSQPPHSPLIPVGLIWRTEGRFGHGVPGVILHDLYSFAGLAFMVGTALWWWRTRRRPAAVSGAGIRVATPDGSQEVPAG